MTLILVSGVLLCVVGCAVLMFAPLLTVLTWWCTILCGVWIGYHMRTSSIRTWIVKAIVWLLPWFQTRIGLTRENRSTVPPAFLPQFDMLLNAFKNMQTICEQMLSGDSDQISSSHAHLVMAPPPPLPSSTVSNSFSQVTNESPNAPSVLTVLTWRGSTRSFYWQVNHVNVLSAGVQLANAFEIVNGLVVKCTLTRTAEQTFTMNWKTEVDAGITHTIYSDMKLRVAVRDSSSSPARYILDGLSNYAMSKMSTYGHLVSFQVSRATDRLYFHVNITVSGTCSIQRECHQWSLERSSRMAYVELCQRWTTWFNKGENDGKHGHDVQLQFQDGSSFWAHKAVLCAHSKVLRDLIDYFEQDSHSSDHEQPPSPVMITLPNTSKSIFLLYVEHLYTGLIPESANILKAERNIQLSQTANGGGDNDDDTDSEDEEEEDQEDQEDNQNLNDPHQQEQTNDQPSAPVGGDPKLVTSAIDNRIAMQADLASSKQNVLDLYRLALEYDSQLLMERLSTMAMLSLDRELVLKLADCGGQHTPAHRLVDDYQLQTERIDFTVPEEESKQIGQEHVHTPGGVGTAVFRDGRIRFQVNENGQLQVNLP